MPNNVYIGSRYVPIFDGDWDNTKTYEPLTIVNYNGGSYTSKQTVPAGTLPTNTTYWALTGNYNGQISNLQQQIDTINNTDLPNINSAIQTLTNNVGNLSDRLDNIIDRRYLIIADSYAAYPSVHWDEELISLLGSSNSVSFKASGYGLARPSYKINDYLNANYASITDPETITDVLWVGGANDRQTSYNAVETELAIFKANIAAKFPNAKFQIGFVGWSTNFTTRIEMCNCMQWYIKAAFVCGVPYMTNSESILHNSLLIDANDSGNIHPNDNGGLAIAKGIYQCIKQNNSNVCYTEPAAFTPNTNLVTSTSTVAFTTLLKDGKIVIKPRSVTLNFVAAVSPSRNIVIGNYTDNLYGGEITMTWHDSTGVNHFAYFKASDGTVNIYMPNGASIGDTVILYFDNPFVCDVTQY